MTLFYRTDPARRRPRRRGTERGAGLGPLAAAACVLERGGEDAAERLGVTMAG
jgi:hypothetical protein